MDFYLIAIRWESDVEDRTTTLTLPSLGLMRLWGLFLLARNADHELWITQTQLASLRLKGRGKPSFCFASSLWKTLYGLGEAKTLEELASEVGHSDRVKGAVVLQCRHLQWVYEQGAYKILERKDTSFVTMDFWIDEATLKRQPHLLKKRTGIWCMLYVGLVHNDYMPDPRSAVRVQTTHSEVQNGSARLMLDATTHKKMARCSVDWFKANSVVKVCKSERPLMPIDLTFVVPP